MNAKTQTESLLAKYIQKLHDLIGADEFDGGDYVYRGQANIEWDVESSAFRRLVNWKHNLTLEDFISYHEKELLEPARRDGYGIKDGRELKDLEILANLQHKGSATCLIDSSRNYLVALWHVCYSKEKEEEKKNGKVIVLDIVDSDTFCSLEEEDLEKSLRMILGFQTRKETITKTRKETIDSKYSIPKPKFWYWRPPVLNNRILKQDGVFILGELKMEGAVVAKYVEVESEHKERLLEELEMIGINERTLFKDEAGFAVSHNHTKSLPHDYGTPKNYFRKGQEALQRNDFALAVSAFSRAITIKHDYAEAYYKRARAKTNLDDFNSAMVDFDIAIKYNRDYEEAYFNRGMIKADMKDLNGALADYDETIRINPNSAENFNNRGIVKRLSGNDQGAIWDYFNAIRQDPGYATAYVNLGRMLIQLDHHPTAPDCQTEEEAIKVLETGDKMVSAPDKEIQYLLGIAMRKQYRLSKDKSCLETSIEKFDGAIEISSEYAHAFFARGLSYRSLGEKEKARLDFLKARELAEEDKDEELLSLIQKELGKTEDP